MAGVKRRSMAKLCLALGLFILAGVFRQLDRSAPPLPSAVFFLLTNLIYIGLAMAWGFSISRRILPRNDRRWLLLGCAMAVLWLFLRAVKYRFFSGDTITRYLWYLYYLPMLFLPSTALSLALTMGERDDWAAPRQSRWLWVGSGVLLALVLTNDVHFLMFRFPAGEGFFQWSDQDYSYGPLFRLVTLWQEQGPIGIVLIYGRWAFPWGPLCCC